MFDGRTGAVRARTDVGGRTQLLRFAPGGRTLVFVRDDGQLVLFETASLSRRLERATTGPIAEGFAEDGGAHVHATRTTLTIARLRARAGAPIDVTLSGAHRPLEVVFLAGGSRFALVRGRDGGGSESSEGALFEVPAPIGVVVEVRALADGALLSSLEADVATVASGGGSLVACMGGVLSTMAIAADGLLRASGATTIGGCARAAELDVTADGRFVYLSDDEGLHVVRAGDGARLSLHLVDAGWGVTAAIVRDDASRWDDGGYFDRPFLLRGEGEITSASLDDARSSFVAGLADHFARGEAPPSDETAQPDDAGDTPATAP